MTNGLDWKLEIGKSALWGEKWIAWLWTRKAPVCIRTLGYPTTP